ncbi:MAG: hypothetical protein LBF60_02425 [Treponema sp.]|jgi:hypothetical protein|nr:hypothetical protein [Treponema sp.]
MKRFLFFSLACLITASSVFAQKKGDVMYVAVKNLTVKSSKSGFFAPVAGSLPYGTPVAVQSVSGSAVEISAGTLSGWVDGSSLTSKRITESVTSTSASAKEIALAGKGFNEEIEDVYRTENANLEQAYAAIGAVESIAVDNDALKQFIVDGSLAGAGEN